MRHFGSLEHHSLDADRQDCELIHAAEVSARESGGGMTRRFVSRPKKIRPRSAARKGWGEPVITKLRQGWLIIGGAGGVGDALAMRLAGQRPVRVLTDGSSLSDSDDLGQLGIESLHGSLDDRAFTRPGAQRSGDALSLMLDQTDAGPSGRRRRGEAIGDAAN